ncbi:hypothetical protein C0J52_02168 [Blattella germanica]|nr:hypothetical protein C0J52_02168 [Blattella germanica]
MVEFTFEEYTQMPIKSTAKLDTIHRRCNRGCSRQRSLARVDDDRREEGSSGTSNPTGLASCRLGWTPPHLLNFS